MAFRGAPFDTPLTRVTEHWNSNQGNKKCAALEMDFIRCGVRVGEKKVKSDCFMEYNDFMECMNSRKQKERVRIMKEERKRQKRPYIEKPPDDSLVQT